MITSLPLVVPISVVKPDIWHLLPQEPRKCLLVLVMFVVAIHTPFQASLPACLQVPYKQQQQQQQQQQQLQLQQHRLYPTLELWSLTQSSTQAITVLSDGLSRRQTHFTSSPAADHSKNSDAHVLCSVNHKTQPVGSQRSVCRKSRYVC